jgi:hypothetical protein
VGDAALVSINSTTGEAKLTAAPNFEAKASYSFVVVAADAVGNTTDIPYSSRPRSLRRSALAALQKTHRQPRLPTRSRQPIPPTSARAVPPTASRQGSVTLPRSRSMRVRARFACCQAPTLRSSRVTRSRW